MYCTCFKLSNRETEEIDMGWRLETEGRGSEFSCMCGYVKYDLQFPSSDPRKSQFIHVPLSRSMTTEILPLN